MAIFCAGLYACTEDPVGNEDSQYSISFTENPVMVGYAEGTYASTVVSEDEWKAESGSPWIMDVNRKDSKVEFTVQANVSEEMRTGKIVFTVPGSSYSKTLNVRQAGNTGSLNVSKSSIVLETVPEAVEVNVNSSENWTAVSDQDWLSVEKKNSSAFVVTAGTNYTGSKQTAEIIVNTASGNESVTVHVEQKADNSLFFGAETEEGRRFAHLSGLVTNVTSDKSYNLHDNVKVLEIQYRGRATGAVKPYALFVFEVTLGGGVTIATTCTDDDDSSIKATDTEETKTQTIRNQLAAMQTKRTSVDVLGGINGDFYYGYGSSTDRNSLLQGVMYRKGNCLKGTFDGGSACTVFAIMKDGKAKIMNQTQYERDKGNIYEALGGRQQLLYAGTPQSSATALEPRTAIGVSSDGTRVIMVVMDGRRDSYSVGASYSSLTKIMEAYDVYNAINLDGGGSSTFAVKENSGFAVKNRPSDSAERKVVNGLAIIAEK